MKQIDMVERWMQLDKQLWVSGMGVGLNLTKFAEDWSVDQKTIRRDLELFKQLGFEAHLKQFERCDSPGKKSKPGAMYRWQYAHGQQPMFKATFDRFGGKRLG